MKVVFFPVRIIESAVNMLKENIQSTALKNGGSVMSDLYIQIARNAAARLSGSLDPRLPQFTEAALEQGESRRSAETFLDGSTVAALASLVVSAAQLAWTVCQDLRKKGSEPRQDVVVRRIRIQLDTPAALSTEDRQNVDRLIEVVVGETLKHGGG